MFDMTEFSEEKIGAEKTVKPSIFSRESWNADNPDFNASYTVKISRQDHIGSLDVINKVFGYEIASGKRRSRNTPDQPPDRFENLKRNLNIVIMQGEGKIFLSKADLAHFYKRYGEYSEKKELTPEMVKRDKDEMSKLEDVLEDAIKERWGQKPKAKIPDNFVPRWMRNKFNRINENLRKI